MQFQPIDAFLAGNMNFNPLQNDPAFLFDLRPLPKPFLTPPDTFPLPVHPIPQWDLSFLDTGITIPCNFPLVKGFDTTAAFSAMQGGSQILDSTNPPNPNHVQRSARLPAAQTIVREARKWTQYSEEEKIQILQNDEYVISFSKTSVTCSGCQKAIRSDSRKGARYYLGFWGEAAGE